MLCDDFDKYNISENGNDKFTREQLRMVQRSAMGCLQSLERRMTQRRNHYLSEVPAELPSFSIARERPLEILPSLHHDTFEQILDSNGLLSSSRQINDENVMALDVQSIKDKVFRYMDKLFRKRLR